VIISSSDGVWKIAEGRRIEARSVDETELMGAWLVISVAYEHFWSHHVIVEGDSLQVINDMRGGAYKLNGCSWISGEFTRLGGHLC